MNKVRCVWSNILCTLTYPFIDPNSSDCPCPTGDGESTDDSDADSERIEEEVVLMDDVDMETIQDYY